MVRAAKVAALAVVLTVGLAACGDDDGPSVTGTQAPTTTAAATTTTGGAGGASATTTTAGSSSATATITVATTRLGEVLADGEGRTLYVFSVDEPDKSNCTGGCLQAWPRFAPDDITAGEGVDEDSLGSITVDGMQQATINQQPLYYFASDAAPGDVNGQGVGGNWWVVAPDGTPIEG